MQTNPKLEEIKNTLIHLHKLEQSIHVDVSVRRKNVKNAPCKITGIYQNFVCVESDVNGYLESFTISYVDILTKQVIIKELV